MALIVLMEDDLTTVKLITEVLKKAGHQVLSADNGIDGLALVHLHKPQLVISDVQMPRMDGLTMLATLRDDPDISATPVVLLTFLDDRSDMRMAMVSGADDYITKPFRFKEWRLSSIGTRLKPAPSSWRWKKPSKPRWPTAPNT